MAGRYANEPGRPIAPLARQHPHKQGELWTPVNGELMRMLEELRDEVGSWQRMARAARVSDRWFRAMRSGQYKAVSMTNLDKIFTRNNATHRVEDLPWYTPEEMLESGAWKPIIDVRAFPGWLKEEREMGRLL
jgi:hypothetical protein